MKGFLLALLLLFHSPIKAKITGYMPSGLQQKSWDIKKACEIMGHKNPLLTDVLNLAWIDCMGHKIGARDFCLKVGKKGGKRSFMRGLVDIKKKKISCSYGYSAVLSIECDEKHGRYCKDKQIGCNELKKHFAHGLDTVRATLAGKKKTQKLNCYYQVKNIEKL